jgi:hypothetical protein
MQRIIGTEVEYGISSPSDPTANPILTSTQAVLAYAAAAGIQRNRRCATPAGLISAGQRDRRRLSTPTRSVPPT